MVLGVVVFPSGLHAVVTVVECLPVFPVPEEDRIATVRGDMVHVCGLHVAPFLHANDTQRMGFQVFLPCLVPPDAIAAFCCGAVFFRIERFVTLIVFGSVRDERCTAWMAAGRVRSGGH